MVRVWVVFFNSLTLLSTLGGFLVMRHVVLLPNNSPEERLGVNEGFVFV
jgi:hypothetical protein